MSFLEWLGSDKSNGKMTLFGIGYIPITHKWNAGFRIESNLATESTPFYLKPYLSMRGLPILRYQGDSTVLGETEQFFNLYKRWSAVLFGGYGIAMNKTNNLEFYTSARQHPILPLINLTLKLLDYRRCKLSTETNKIQTGKKNVKKCWKLC